MNHVMHSTCNRMLGAPLGWDHTTAPVDALPITDDVLNGMHALASFWKPSPQELQALNEGGLVVLHVLGVMMPPVSVSVTPAE